ncbi:contractile injection system protein, VgrG/Pvc8 family [Cohnella terricola]|nr:contractile injection system protein, VgrG/Pvc8 family [Cohnella terricola]
MSTPIVAYDALKIAPFEMRLHDVKLVKKINEHARLTFTGVIPDDKEESYVRMADEQTAIELLYTDASGKSQRLFHGMILRLQVKVSQGVYWLEAEAVSHTYAMDIKQEYRSFQNHSMLITDVMKKINNNYPKAQTINTFSDERSLGAYLLQYQETDWQFLKRLASHYHTVLIPITTQDSIRMYLGFPNDRNAGELKSTHYRVFKDLLAYKNEVDSDNPNLNEQDYISYEVELNQILELGDKVTFKGRKLHVFEVQTEMTRGVLTNKYTLCAKKAGYQRKKFNRNIIGASIQGKVREVVRDEVKVQLDYDQDWSLQTSSPFPYSTMYASDDQTGWYCMPEKGDDIRLYFPSTKEPEGIAISSVRKKLPQEATQNSTPKNVTTTVVKQEILQPIIQYDSEVKDDLMKNPNTKYLLTPTGQKILFEEDKITIVGADGGAAITLTNAGTIILNSSNKISIQTGKQIEMVSQSIMMVANQIEMSTAQGLAKFKIDQGQVLIKGVEVLMEK